MKNSNTLENLVFSVGGLIFIALIFSGWKGMLAAAAVLGWLLIMARVEKNHSAREEQERSESMGRVYRFDAAGRAHTKDVKYASRRRRAS
ncbi:MAG: hypothetical protein IJ744_01250 [Lachnospiraceae bacterium]|nr:hypothetical protein [Lachnospiraceae bacterium]